MEIWGEISKKLNNAADYTAKETEKLTGIAKISYKLSGAKTKLSGLYQNLGKLKYNELRGNQPEEGAYEAVLQQIDDLNAEIAQMETELGVLRNYKFCIACGNKLRGEMVYCPKCGAKQIPLEAEPAGEENAEEADTAESSDAEETIADDTAANGEEQ